MTQSAEVGGADAGAVVTARPRPRTNLAATLRRLAAETGRPLTSILADHVKTSLGPGKVSFDEFVALRLFDVERYARADLREFVGFRAMRDIWVGANFRLEFFDVIRNKIAMKAMLEAHGFPAIPIDAFFTTAAGYDSPKCLRSAEALKSYLTARASYPLFGKPMHGFQSLGSASLLRFDRGEGRLLARDGSEIGIDAFVADIAKHYSDGYLFQPHVSPHPENRALCGDRLATVRVMTLMTRSGPKIWRVCEKLPAGANVADNYWRPGNLLVRLDPESGRRSAATSGTGFALVEHSRHPDTGAAVEGASVPNWSTVCELAKEGARLFKETGVIGWDVAPIENGALIVEANATPDLFLVQLAERRGALDPELRSFLGERRRSQREWKRRLWREANESGRPTWI
jgi:hypothetical protein